MAKLMLVVLAGGLALSSAGCATIAGSGPDFVPVSSKPPGASVKLDGFPVGKTPLIVAFDRRSEGVLTFELDGFESKTLDIDKVPNGWFFANLLWAPVWPVVPIGMIVDLCASNQGKYSTSPIQVELKPVSQTLKAAAP